MNNSCFVHDTAIVDADVYIGNNSRIWHWTHISEGVQIGRDCVLGQNVFVGKNVKIGNGCKVQNNVSIYEGVELEDGVFVGPSVVFTNVINPRAFMDKKSEFRKTLIKSGATLGANATIICGVCIGEYALIGAGAVVTKNVKPFALAMGSPARQMGTVDKSGRSMQD